MVRMPLKESTADYRAVDPAKAEEEGFEIGKEYFEPIEEYHFVFTKTEDEAKKLVKTHLQKWS